MAKITNEQKYKTAEERVEAYLKYKGFDYSTMGRLLAIDYFGWLALEAEEEKLEPCPFCGGKCSVETINVLDDEDDKLESYQAVICYGQNHDGCGYSSRGFDTEAEAISAHNRVCHAVEAEREMEVKL